MAMHCVDCSCVEFIKCRWRSQVTWTATRMSSSLVSLRDAPVTFSAYDRTALAAESPTQVGKPAGEI